MYHNSIASQSQYLLDLSDSGSVRPWRDHKVSNQLLALAYDQINPQKSIRLRDCAMDLTFFTDPLNSKRKRLASANFCRVRLCPMCQWRRSLKVYGQVRRIMSAIASDKPLAFIFLTLTVRNVSGPLLKDSIDHLMQSWVRFAALKPLKDVVLGYYRALEVTHNTDPSSPHYDTFHPHFHVLLAVDPGYFKSRHYLSRDKWADLWRRSARLDYDPSVDVRRVKGDTAEAVSEAAKYSIKSADYIFLDDWDLTVQTVDVLDKALDNRRLISFGGVFADWHRRLNLDDADSGDLVHLQQDPILPEDCPKIYFTWRSGYSQYCRAFPS